MAEQSFRRASVRNENGRAVECAQRVSTDAVDLLTRDQHDILQTLTLLGDGVSAVTLQRLTKQSKGCISLKDTLLLRQHCWEKLHCFHWSDTPTVYRRLYGITTILLVCAYMTRLRDDDNDCGVKTTQLLFTADLGALLGDSLTRSLLNELIDAIDITCLPKPLLFHIRTSPASSQPLPPSNAPRGRAVDIVHRPSLVSFYQSYLLPQKPVLLTGCLDHWPALSSPLTDQRWSSLDYIISVAGHRTVPVEVGGSYLLADSGTKLMTVTAFIEQHILQQYLDPSGTEHHDGYLAQHELLEHIPRLKQDIAEPDYCSLLLPCDESLPDSSMTQDHEVIVNTWFGPEHTISPLHFDCYYNLLAQVSGYKYIRLYHPKETDKLYSLSGKMSNNSAVNLVSESVYSDFPLLKDAEYEECMLKPGDMLFIPRWYWHHVQAVDQATAKEWFTSHQSPVELKPSTHSFSVSFWWGKRITEVDSLS